MRNAIKYLLPIVVASVVGISFADARLTPGTIQKGQYTGGNTCNTSTNSYDPAGFSCSENSSACRGGQFYADPYECGHMVGEGTGAYYQSQTCYGSPYCHDWQKQPSYGGAWTYTNYLLNSETLSYGAVGSGNQKLGADVGYSCSRTSNGTNHTPAQRNGSTNCEQNNGSYYPNNGANGVCNSFSSTDSRLDSYTQNGQANRSNPSDGDSTCTVEGRYADPDNSGPSISVNSVASVFSTDGENWCNLAKYRNEGFAAYTSTQNPELPGCTYYKARTGHATTVNPDLLENLSVTVSDTSGISDIRVEFGSCDATYSFPTDINSILQSPGGQGTTGRFADQTNIVIPYNATFTVRGTTHPGLVAKFGKTRLDQCLSEGRNYLKITARDNARSDQDATTYDPNSATLDLAGSNGYINIDNSTPKFRLSGDAKDVAAASDGSQCFDGGLSIADRFKNYNVGGNLETTDPWGADSSPNCGSCTVLTETGFNCNTVKTKPSHPQAIWVSPGNINPTTGIYTVSYCDGGSPLPDPQTCDWDCNTGYVCDADAAQSCVCAYSAGNPTCTTMTYRPCKPQICAAGYTYNAGLGKCVLGGGLMILFDDSTIASNPTASTYKATLMNNSSATEPSRLVNPPDMCGANAPKSLKYSGTGTYYGAITSWPAPMNDKIYPVQAYCP
jgi:hypothetical protein